jgi:hypothetical protein
VDPDSDLTYAQVTVGSYDKPRYPLAQLTSFMTISSAVCTDSYSSNTRFLFLSESECFEDETVQKALQESIIDFESEAAIRAREEDELQAAISISKSTTKMSAVESKQVSHGDT